MSRLVVVSNRIAPPDNKGGAGGLAVGVLGALKAAGGLWFGWSGEIGNEDEPLKKVTKGNITWASFNLSEQDYEDYYCQFSNAVVAVHKKRERDPKKMRHHVVSHLT